MNKWIKNIITIFTALVFLISVNGVLLIDHTCLSCNTEEISVYFSDINGHDCHENIDNLTENCCSGIHEECGIGNFDCCKYYYELVRVEIPFSFSETGSIQLVKVILLNFVLPDYILSDINNSVHNLFQNFQEPFPVLKISPVHFSHLLL
ncbi:MAG: hypothetical protein ABIJ97_06520 [Bacteroidota bacterium]